jgi:hypothetical protein
LRRSGAPTASTGASPPSLAEVGDALLDRVEEGLLKVEVVDRVGGDVELGKDDQVAAALMPSAASATSP